MEKTLFYSKYCEHSKNFILELKKLGIINYFDNYICVDKRKQLPEFVKKVPCIVIPDNEEPLFADKAFSWLDFMKMKKAQHEAKQSNINSFDFNNGFDNFDKINDGDDDNKNMTKKDGLGLDMLEQPLMDPNDVKKLTEKYENKSFEERLAELENTRS